MLMVDLTKRKQVNGEKDWTKNRAQSMTYWGIVGAGAIKEDKLLPGSIKEDKLLPEV